MQLTGRAALDAGIRALIAEDARWVADMMLSTQRSRDDVAAIAPQMLLGFSSRIVVEGARTARSKSVAAAARPVVDLLPGQDDPLIVAARHASKLTDGVEAGSSELARQLVVLRDAHRKSLFGLAPRFLWGRLADLALVRAGDVRLGLSVPLQFQYGAAPSVTWQQLGQFLAEVARRHGQVLAVLTALDPRLPTPSAELDLSGIPRLHATDTRSSVVQREYLQLPIGEALQLAAIEGQVNTALYLLTCGEGIYPGPVLRARFLTLVHAVRSIQKIAEAIAAAHPAKAARLRSLLLDGFVQELLTGREAADLRARLMHYSIRSDRVVLESERPLLGLVEASWPVMTAEDLTARSLSALQVMSAGMAAWRS